MGNDIRDTYLSRSLKVVDGQFISSLGELKSPVITVWGEGQSNDPYNRERYHLGHILVITLLRAIAMCGPNIKVLLTADTFRELTGELPVQFYRQRMENVRSWLQASISKPDLDVSVAEESIRGIRNSSEYGSLIQAWSLAYDRLRPYIEDLSREYDTIPEPTRQDICRIFDEARNGKGTWKACRSHFTANLREILSKLETQQFANLMPGDLECLVFLACVKRKQWLHTGWLQQVACLLSSSGFREGDLLEAQRNMYVWRVFRLFLTLAGTGSNIELGFPRLIEITNFPNLQSKRFMASIEQASALRVFEEDGKIVAGLSQSAEPFRLQLAERIVVPYLCDTQGMDLSLAQYYVSPTIDKFEWLRETTLQVLQYYREFWPEEPRKNLRIDNWFCINYALTHVLSNTELRNDFHGFFSKYVNANPDLYRPRYVQLASAIVDEVTDQAVSRADRAKRQEVKSIWETVQGLVKSSIDLDVLLHLSGKRYRDHSLHQIHVSILGHLFLTALTPKSTYRKQEKVIDALSKRERVSPMEIYSAWWIASLLHDHAYPLLHLLRLSSVLSQLKTHLHQSPENTLVLENALEAFVGTSISDLLQQVLRDVKETASSEPFHLKGSSNTPLVDTASEILDNDLPEIPGHGLLSAVNLYSLLKARGVSNPMAYYSVRTALKAMALHDAEYPIFLSKSPIAFILVLSDELQEWSRRMFWGEKQQVESNYIEIGPFELLSEKTYRLPNHLDVNFYRVSTETLGVPWDFSFFRDSKRENLERLKLESQNIFPETLHFDVKVDCGSVGGIRYIEES